MRRTFLSRFLLVLLFFIPLIAFAQNDIVPCGPQPGQQPCKLKDLFGLLVAIYNFLLGMAGLVAFVFLVYGGIRMFFYSVDEENLALGKKTVLEALIGLAIVAMAYLVVNTLLAALGIGDAGSYFSGAKLFGGQNP